MDKRKTIEQGNNIKYFQLQKCTTFIESRLYLNTLK